MRGDTKGNRGGATGGVGNRRGRGDGGKRERERERERALPLLFEGNHRS